MGRRKFLQTLGTAAVAGLGGCTGFVGSDRFEYREVKYFATSEPIVEDADVSTTEPSDFYYGALVRTPSEKEAIRWEFLEAEQSLIAEDYRSLSFDRSFVVIAGSLLKGPHELHVAETEFLDETMRQTVEIRPRPGRGDLRVVNAVEVYHDNGNEPPDELVVEWRTPPVSAE